MSVFDLFYSTQQETEPTSKPINENSLGVIASPSPVKRWGVYCPYIGFTFWYDDPDIAASRAIEYEGQVIEDERTI